MKRQHLFRALQTNTHRWVYGTYHKINNKYYMVGFLNAEHYSMSVERREKENICLRVYEIDKNTIGEFTGLTTSSSHPMFVDIERVFEGDVVVLNNCKTKFTIVFDDFRFYGMGDDGDKYGAYTINLSELNRKKDFKIIGNVHQKLN